MRLGADTILNASDEEIREALGDDFNRIASRAKEIVQRAVDSCKNNGKDALGHPTIESNGMPEYWKSRCFEAERERDKAQEELKKEKAETLRLAGWGMGDDAYISILQDRVKAWGKSARLWRKKTKAMQKKLEMLKLHAVLYGKGD